MANNKTDIYIGTVLLEVNRWNKADGPTFAVSEWVERFKEAGFDGMELWDLHAIGNEAESQALANCGLPVSVFNSYALFHDAHADERRECAEMCKVFSAPRVKFNFGYNKEERDESARNFPGWVSQLPPDCTPLCECHGRTLLEDPVRCAEVFALADRKVEIIIHGFGASDDSVRTWFEHFGKQVTHIHVAMSGAEGENQRLSADPERVKARIGLLHEVGFTGSFTLEFTEGTRAEGENIDDLWKAALDDLHFLRANW